MKNLKLLITVSLVTVLLSGCGCKHQWKDATCQAPKTCELCGITEGEPIPHEWLAATCTEPRTCFVCKLTEGEANGHNWENATCIVAETCSVCGETRGDPLGHVLTNTAQTREATCAQIGLIEGTCTRCNKMLTEETPTLAHTPGEWSISVPATYDNNGKKEICCTLCSAVLQEESYELTAEEKELWYKDVCKQLPYKDIARTPSNYIGNRIKITGEVGNVCYETSSKDENSVYLVHTKNNYGYYYEDSFFVFVDNYGSNSRILQGDFITFYGEVDGLYDEYGQKYPKLIAKYYELKE